MTKPSSRAPQQEIRNEIRIEAADLLTVLQPPERRPKAGWIAGSAALFFVAVTILVFVDLEAKSKLFALIVALLSVLWCSAIVHLRYQNGVVTSMILLVGTSLTLLAGGYIAPIDVPGILRKGTAVGGTG